MTPAPSKLALQRTQRGVAVAIVAYRPFDAAVWDKEFEDDVPAGRVKALADDGIRDLRESPARSLT